MVTPVSNSKIILGNCDGNDFAVIYDGSTDVYIRLNKEQAVYAAKNYELFQNISVPESDGLHNYSDDGTVEKLVNERANVGLMEKGLWVGWTYSKMHIVYEPFPHSETVIVRRSKEDILSDIVAVIAQLQKYKPIRKKL